MPGPILCPRHSTRLACRTRGVGLAAEHVKRSVCVRLCLVAHALRPATTFGGDSLAKLRSAQAGANTRRAAIRLGRSRTAGRGDFGVSDARPAAPAGVARSAGGDAWPADTKRQGNSYRLSGPRDAHGPLDNHGPHDSQVEPDSALDRRVAVLSGDGCGSLLAGMAGGEGRFKVKGSRFKLQTVPIAKSSNPQSPIPWQPPAPPAPLRAPGEGDCFPHPRLLIQRSRGTNHPHPRPLSPQAGEGKSRGFRAGRRPTGRWDVVGVSTRATCSRPFGKRILIEVAAAGVTVDQENVRFENIDFVWRGAGSGDDPAIAPPCATAGGPGRVLRLFVPVRIGQCGKRAGHSLDASRRSGAGGCLVAKRSDRTDRLFFASRRCRIGLPYDRGVGRRNEKRVAFGVGAVGAAGSRSATRRTDVDGARSSDVARRRPDAGMLFKRKRKRKRIRATAGRNLLFATACAFVPEQGEPLVRLTGETLPEGFAAALRWSGQGSLASPQTVMVASRGPDGPRKASTKHR